MIRKKLAALTLIAGMGFLSGCAGSYSFGRLWNGQNASGLHGGDCCTGDYGTVGAYSGLAGTCSNCEGGPVLFPQDGIGVIPQTGTPILAQPPATGSGTNVIPIPQSIPVPYTPPQ